MKLAAVFVVWDDWELLFKSIDNIEPVVDGVIVVYSETSNFGEISEPPFLLKACKVEGVYQYEPNLKLTPRENETNKRNYGLGIARELGYTHFLMMDADEFYEPEPFLKEKEKFKNPDLMGLVCQCQTYFKSPGLTIGLDTTLVPFIHKLTPTIAHAFNKSYPFAWINGQIRIDPTRSLNINSRVERTDLIMDHFSWYRRDYSKKIRNSTARRNIETSTIIEDLRNAKEGYFCKFYQKTLIACDNKYNLPLYEDNIIP
jgi:hypothetical protein